MTRESLLGKTPFPSLSQLALTLTTQADPDEPPHSDAMRANEYDHSVSDYNARSLKRRLGEVKFGLT